MDGRRAGWNPAGAVVRWGIGLVLLLGACAPADSNAGAPAATVTYTVRDPGFDNMPAMTFQVPQGWIPSSQVMHNPADPKNAVIASATFQAPDGSGLVRWVSTIVSEHTGSNSSAISFLSSPQALAVHLGQGLFEELRLPRPRVRSAVVRPNEDAAAREVAEFMHAQGAMSVQSFLLDAVYDTVWHGRKAAIRYVDSLVVADCPMPCLSVCVVCHVGQCAVLADASRLDEYYEKAGAIVESRRTNPEWSARKSGHVAARTIDKNRQTTEAVDHWVETRTGTTRKVGDAWDNAIRDVDVHDNPLAPGTQVESSSLSDHTFMDEDGTIYDTDSSDMPWGFSGWQLK